MKIGNVAATNGTLEKVVVVIKNAYRIKGGKRDGKIDYQTVDSIDITDATADEVQTAVMNGLKAAANKK